MSLIDRLASRLGFERRAAYALGPWDSVFAGHYAKAGVTAAENLASVLACVGATSTSLASLPALLYRRAGGERMEVTEHPFLALVRNGPNPHQSWPDFIESLVASTLLTGNGLAAIERAPTGEVAALRVIPWACVTVTLLPTGRLAYDVSEPQRRYRMLQGEVVHLRDRSDNGMIGRSRLDRARETVDTALGVNAFARGFISQGAYPSGVLSTPAKVSPEAMARLRESFSKVHEGAANARRTMLLEEGMTFTPTQISPEDAELLASRKFSVEEVCRIFQVPPPLVQDYSHNTFTNSETAGRWFAQFTLGPWARKIECEFARSVFGPASGLELELDLSGFLRGDPATRWQAHAIAVKNNILTVDEVRAVEGYNPLGRAAGALA